MNRTDLIRKYAAKHNVPKQYAAEICESVLSLIASGIATDKRVTLLGLGTFKKVQIAPKRIGNINGVGTTELPSRTKVVFDFSPSTKNRVVPVAPNCAMGVESMREALMCATSPMEAYRLFMNYVDATSGRSNAKQYQPKICEQCGRPYNPTTGSQRYCSGECRQSHSLVNAPVNLANRLGAKSVTITV